MDVQQTLRLIEAQPQLLGALLLLAAALIEYVFPPFPGDVICLFGAFLVGHGGWSLPLVFTAVLLGNLLGLTADYGLGILLRRRARRRQAARQTPSRRLQAVLALEPRFQHRAAVVLLMNRFLPGVRALLFVGAGFYRYPLGKTLLWGALSALGWNTLIFVIGVTVGLRWAELSGVLSSYSMVVWALLGIAGVIVGIRWYVRRRRRPPAGPDGEP